MEVLVACLCWWFISDISGPSWLVGSSVNFFFFFFLIKTWEYGMPQGRGFNVAILLKGARMRPDAWFCVWKQTTWVVI